MSIAATNSVPSPAWQSVPQTSDSSFTHLTEACALLALMVKSQSASQTGAKTDVDLDFKKMQELKQQLLDAIQHAQDAAQHSGFFGFLSSVFGSEVAEIAGAVAAVAAIVATAGSAAPAVLMAISLAMQEGAKVAQKLGLDPKICAFISLAAAALGACSNLGVSTAAIGAVSSGSATTVSTLGTVARDVKQIASFTKAAAQITGGVLGGVAGHYESQQLNYQADATGYQAQNDSASMDLDAALASLQTSLRTEQRETDTTSAIIQDNSDTKSALSERI